VTRWYRLSPLYWLARWLVRRIVKRWSFSTTVSNVLARKYGDDHVPMVASAMTDLIRKRRAARAECVCAEPTIARFCKAHGDAPTG